MHPISYETGDLFTSRAQVIVNPVNCQGIMGKGLALVFKQRYPKMFRVYQQQCRSGELAIGRPTLYKESHPWILNFPTKNVPREASKLIYIERGFAFLRENYQRLQIESIAFPKLGCGEGRLSWDEVGPIMVATLAAMDVPTFIYVAESDKQYQADV